MGTSRPKWAASNADLDRAADIALRAAEVLRELAHGAEMLGTALIEVRRYRKALAEETAPLDWTRFVEELRIEDPALASALDGARPARFALGDLSLCCENGTDYVMCSLKSEQLQKKLAERYGCEFKLKIRQQA